MEKEETETKEPVGNYGLAEVATKTEVRVGDIKTGEGLTNAAALVVALNKLDKIEEKIDKLLQ